MEKKLNKKAVIAIIAAVAVIAAGIIAFAAIDKNRIRPSEVENAESTNVDFDILVEGDRIKSRTTTVQEMVDNGWAADKDINEKPVPEEGKDYTYADLTVSKNGCALEIRVNVDAGKAVSSGAVTDLAVADNTAEIEAAGQKIVLGQTKVKDLIGSGWTERNADLNLTIEDEEAIYYCDLTYGDSSTNFIIDGNVGDIFTDCVITGASY